MHLLLKKNFDVIEMHGRTITIKKFPAVSEPKVQNKSLPSHQRCLPEPAGILEITEWVILPHFMDCIVTSSSKTHFNIMPLIFHVISLCGNTATCSLGRGPRPLRSTNIVSSASSLVHWLRAKWPA